MDVVVDYFPFPKDISSDLKDGLWSPPCHVAYNDFSIIELYIYLNDENPSSKCRSVSACMCASPPVRTPASTAPHTLHAADQKVLIRRRGPIEKELGENAQIQQQRAETADQPARIDEHIPRIRGRPLAGATVARHAADGRVGDDAHDVGEVADAGEEEEEQRDAVGALAAPVEEDLGHARAEVEGGAQVAEDLAPDVEAPRALPLQFRVAVAVPRPAPADPPAEDAGRADEHDREEVEDDRLRGRGRRQVLGRGRVGGRRSGQERGRGREVGAVDAGQAVAERGGGACAVAVDVCWGMVGIAVRVTVDSGEEGFVLGRVVVDDGFRGRVGEGEAAVVEALAEQDNVRERVVDCQNDHGREDALEHGSEDVEDIAREPDDDEEEGEAVGRTAAEVFDDLGREHYYPARD